MGCAEGRSPFAGSLRDTLRYDISPLSGQEGGRWEGRKGFSAHCLITELDAPIEVKPWFELFGPRFEGQRRLRELRSV